MQKITNKILAVLITLVMLAINFAPTAVQAAEDLNNIQDNLTNDANVEFSAKINGEHTVVAQVGEKLELEFEVKVLNEGYVKDAVIEFKDNNFKILEDTMENFNGVTVDGGLKYDLIKAEDTKISKVQAEFDTSKNVKESDFNRECEITFSAVYVNELGREKEIEKKIKANVEWQVNDIEAEIYQELVRYIKYDNKTMVTYRINENVKDDKVPAKVSEVQTIIPEINKTKPTTINVIGEYSEYKEQDGVLIITKDEGVIPEENEEEQEGLKEEKETKKKDKEEKEYKWETENSYIVTYIYDEQEEITTLDLTSQVNIETVLGQKIENKIESKEDVTNEVGSLIELDLEGTPKLSKGYMYTNLVRADKLDTEFNTAYKINVATKDIVDKIVLREQEYLYNEFKTEIVNTKVSTHKEELEKVLGEEGKITVKDLEGNEIAVLNKENEEAEINAKEIVIETTTPVEQGVITVNVDKKIDETLEYTREAIKEIQSLNTKAILEGYMGENIISSKEFITSIVMEEPVSSADIAMEPRNLSTAVEKQDVEIDVRLNNAKAEDALFTDPIIEVELPEQVTNVEIKSADIIYENELVPAEIKVEGKVIRATLVGTQTQYNDDGIINGSIIRIHTNVSVDRMATSSDEKVTLRYGNSATMEEGTKEIDTEVVAPVDFITLQGMQIEDKEIIAMDEMKEVEISSGVIHRTAKIAGKVVNNLKRNADGFTIIGRIPTEGMKSLTGEDIATTETTNLAKAVEVKNLNAKVYYSDNVNETLDGNWSDTPAVTSKTFKIVSEEEIPHSKEVEFEYEVELPQSVGSNEEIFATYGVVYNTNAVAGEKYNVVEAKMVGAYTEGDSTLSVAAELYDTNTGEAIPDNQPLYAGQAVTYKVKVTNNDRQAYTNVSVKGILETLIVDEGTTSQHEELKNLEFVDYKEEFEGTNIYSDIKALEDKEKTIIIDQIGGNETKEVEFKCRFYNYTAPSVNQETGEEIPVNINMTVEVKYGSRTVNRVITRGQKYSDVYCDIVTSEAKVTAPENKLQTIFVISNANKSSSRSFDLRINIPEYFYISKLDLNGEIYNSNELSYFIKDNGEFILEAEDLGIREGGLGTYSKKQISIEFTAKEISRIREEATLSADVLFRTQDENNQNIVHSNNVEFIIEDNSIVEAIQTVNVEGTIKDTYPQIIFQTKMTNGSEFGKTLKFSNDLNADIDMYEASITLNGETKNIIINDNKISTDFYLERGKEAVVTIYAKTRSANQGVVKTIVNKPKITATTGEIPVNEVRFNIEGTIVDPGPDPEIPVNPDNEKHSINGIVWIDENNNGLRDNEEYRSEGNVVRLYHNGAIVATTTTNARGEYSLQDVIADQDAYYVLIDYDISQYNVSSVVNENRPYINNDFTEQLYDNKKIASSCKINLVNTDVYNIDLGLVAKNDFDFKLDKYITNATITNSEYSAREYRFVNTKNAKIEVPTKNIENTTVILKFKIVVTNIGKESGYVKNIVDYLPATLTFESELNNGWYLSQDGNLYNSSLSNMEIYAGESKEVVLTLTKKINGENLGDVVNTAEIYELYNVKGYQDANSIPGNRNESEDDIDSADILILASTGKLTASILAITLFILSIIGTAVYVIKQEVNEKKGGNNNV